MDKTNTDKNSIFVINPSKKLSSNFEVEKIAILGITNTENTKPICMD